MIDVKSEFDWFKAFFKNFSAKRLIYIFKLRRPPILIGGCGRSGTSLLLSILSAHPNIYGIPVETNIFGYKRKFKYPLLNRLNNYRKLLPFLFKFDKNKANRWLEKTPRNIRFITESLKEFNNKVFIIHIIRDGRDVVTSSHPTNKNIYHTDIERWVYDVKCGLKFKDHPNVLTIKYEDLVNNFNPTIKNIILFLKEDYKTELENFEKFSNVIKHRAFEGGKVSKIRQNRIGRWKDPRHSKIIEEFYSNSQAKELLDELNYL